MLRERARRARRLVGGACEGRASSSASLCVSSISGSMDVETPMPNLLPDGNSENAAAQRSRAISPDMEHMDPPRAIPKRRQIPSRARTYVFQVRDHAYRPD